MSAEIERTEPVDDDRWWDAWEGCDHATYYQSPGWARVWESYTDGELTPAPQLVTFADGTEVVLPVCERSAMRGVVNVYEMSPAHTFGGWLPVDPIETEHAEALLEYTLDTYSNLWWRQNPYDPHMRELHVPYTKEDVTQIVDLEDGFEAAHDGWRSSHRRDARNAEDEGVEIRRDDDLADWQAYYKAYEASLERWGEDATSSHRWELFDRLAEEGENVQLWIAEVDGQLASGAVLVYGPDHVAYWHGAAHEEYFDLNPNHLLFREAMRDAAERGLRWFDFNPSGGHEGVRRFKSGFGAEDLPANILKQETAALQGAEAVWDLLEG